MAELPAKSRAIIGIGNNDVRKAMDQRFPQIDWVTIVHPSAIVDPSVELGPGTVIFAGAVVQPQVKIGRHVIINTKASVDHDSFVGDYATVSPGATICGDVRIGEGSYAHAGSTVHPHRSMASRCTLGLGAALVHSMHVEGETWVGVPAKRLRSRPTNLELASSPTVTSGLPSALSSELPSPIASPNTPPRPTASPTPAEA
mmetsp:Transcript_27152/g.54638  ORF Transcript_27152/g.54638 Transcript_27152/m.54638 type:complete len:201 (-) Transcript_27152:224-826(-)